MCIYIYIYTYIHNLIYLNIFPALPTATRHVQTRVRPSNTGIAIERPFPILGSRIVAISTRG